MISGLNDYGFGFRLADSRKAGTDAGRLKLAGFGTKEVEPASSGFSV